MFTLLWRIGGMLLRINTFLLLVTILWKRILSKRELILKLRFHIWSLSDAWRILEGCAEVQAGFIAAEMALEKNTSVILKLSGICQSLTKNFKLSRFPYSSYSPGPDQKSIMKISLCISLCLSLSILALYESRNKLLLCIR